MLDCPQRLETEESRRSHVGVLAAVSVICLAHPSRLWPAAPAVAERFARLAGGLAGVLAIVYVMCAVYDAASSRMQRCMQSVSQYTYDIYLLHVIVIHLLFTIYAHLKLPPSLFLPWLLTHIVLTAAIAIAMAKTIRQVPPTRRLVLGIP